VRNTGSDSPVLGDDVTLAVAPPQGAEVLADGPVTWERGDEVASAVRGERAVFARPVLRPGRNWEACRVENARGSMRASVHWRGADGRRHMATVREGDARAASPEVPRIEGLP
jgi:hypothetical protein